jgi:hypothetical protein
MKSTKFVHNNTHVDFLLIVFSRIKAIKQKSIKEVTLQFSMIFQIRLKNNNVNFRVICPLTLSQFPQSNISYKSFKT